MTIAAIPRRKCTICNSTFSTFAKKPYCSICIKNICELSHMKDSAGRHRCNSAFDIIERKNKLCVGHYKMLQQYCYVCGHCKIDDECLSYDDYYYCTKHKPVPQDFIVRKTLNNVLNNDIIENIIQKIVKF